MYRKYFISAVLALAASLASCSKEEPLGDELVAVQFNASVSPEISVLVKGAGVQPQTVIADHAVLQIWRGGECVANVQKSLDPGQTELDFGKVKIAAGVDYDVYVWVDCSGYYNTGDLRQVSLRQEKNFDGNSPGFDAFYAYTPVNCSRSSEEHNLVLKRPFARLGFTCEASSGVKISFSAPTALNLRTGKVSGLRAFQYTTTDPVESVVTAFDYVFADEGRSYLDYTFEIYGLEPKTATVPVSRNTKTNIIYNTN